MMTQWLIRILPLEIVGQKGTEKRFNLQILSILLFSINFVDAEIVESVALPNLVAEKMIT